MFKRAKRQLRSRSEPRLRSESKFVKNSKPPVSTNSDSRRSVLKKKDEWKKNSSASLWRNSPKMIVSSRWMLREDACASWNTNGRLSVYGKKSLLFISNSVRLRQLSNNSKLRKRAVSAISSPKRNRDFWPSMLPSCSNITPKQTRSITLDLSAE